MAIPFRPLVVFVQQFTDFVSLSVDEPIGLLQTTFGLQLEVSDIKDRWGAVIIPDDRSLKQLENDSQKKKTKSSIPQYYRLFSDYQTSFFWYDEYSPRENPPDIPHINQDIIKERYPALMPFHAECVMRYQKAFDQGFDKWVFPNLTTHVAWEVAGFFIAWWIVMQDEETCIRYELVSKHYVIKKDNVEQKLWEFLIDLNGYSKERRGFDY